MLKQFSLIFGVLLAVFTITIAPFRAEAALTDSFKSAACKAVNPKDNPDTKKVDETKCEGGGSAINNLLKIVLNILSLVVGVTAIIILIISGIKFVSSQGDPQAISSARNTIIYAVIGLIVVAIAQFIVQFVLKQVASKS